MIITYEQFKNSIIALQNASERDYEFSKAMDMVLDGRFIGQLAPELCKEVLTLLEIATGDKHGFISWWLYEKPDEPGEHMFDENNNVIATDTIDDMYNYLKDMDK